MVTIPFTGQFGNQLMVYVVAKIIAERTQQDYFPPRTWLKKDMVTPVAYSSSIPFIAQPQMTMGRGAVTGPTQHIRSMHWIDLDAIDPARPIHVESYCQRFELIQPYADKIRNEWLKVREDAFVKTDPETVYIHVRRTDYVGDNLNPDQQCIAHTIPEYLRCLEEFPDAQRAVIITDDSLDPFISPLRSAIADKMPTKQCSSESRAWDQDFMTLASAENVIISQSTFSWWSCFLGKAKKVVCPIPRGSLWHRGMGLMGPPKPGCGDYPNLETNEPGWKWVVM